MTILQRHKERRRYAGRVVGAGGRVAATPVVHVSWRTAQDCPRSPDPVQSWLSRSHHLLPGDDQANRPDDVVLAASGHMPYLSQCAAARRETKPSLDKTGCYGMQK